MIGLIVLTTAGSALIYRSLTTSGQTRERLIQTSRIRTLAEQLIRLIGDAQSGERGFLLSGNEKFLETYAEALTAVPQTAAHLRDLLADDQTQTTRLKTIEALFGRWHDTVAEPEIAARRAAPPGYAAAHRVAADLSWRLRAAAAADGGTRRTTELATALHSQLTAILRMTPPGDISSDWPRTMRLLESIVDPASGRSPASLAQAAAAVDAFVRQRALAADAAESKVLTSITRRSGEMFVESIRREYAQFEASEETRLGTQIAQGRSAVGTAQVVTIAISLAVFALLLAGVVHATAAAQAVGAIIGAARAMAAGDLTRRVRVSRRDEIGELSATFNDMADQIATRGRQADLLSEMGEMLQASISVDEALGVVRRYAWDLFQRPGAVYLLNPSRNAAEMAAAWSAGSPEDAILGFDREDCWALRRGQPYLVEDTQTDVACRHLPSPPPRAYFCLPLTAQGETLGVLYLAVPAGERDGTGPRQGPDVPRRPAGAPPAVTPDRGQAGKTSPRLGGARAAGPALPDTLVQLARTVGDRTSLAIANLRLRESLRAQSIRDPLTGLFNRRYMEETLERELRRAERAQTHVGVLMVDIDRFKGFNDTFGHDAGDVVLRELGYLFQSRFRGEDILCRYGGEEFVLILPEVPPDDAVRRATDLEDAVRHLAVSHHGQSLGSITVSIGVALFPTHGGARATLIAAADAALYRAKQNGRARVEVVA